jgi:hypothetical protein
MSDIIVNDADGVGETTSTHIDRDDTDQTGQGAFAPVTAQDLCPVCGRPDWCSWLVGPSDRLRVVCMRYDTDGNNRPGRPTKNGGWLYSVDDADEILARVSVRAEASRPAAVTHAGWQWAAENYARPATLPDDSGRRAREGLEMRLGLPPGAYDGLDLVGSGTDGWKDDEFWSIPVRDEFGDIVGIMRRYLRHQSDGKNKRLVKDSSAGLFLPRDFRAKAIRSRTVSVVEGIRTPPPEITTGWRWSAAAGSTAGASTSPGYSGRSRTT